MIERRSFGATGCELARIGISSSFGADESVFHEAFARGCNYFTWGTFIRGRSAPFKNFMGQVTRAGRRDELFLGLLSYSHNRWLGDRFLHSALKQLGTDYIDGLILGYYPKRPPQRVLDWAIQVREQGLVRFIGLTTHNRSMIGPLVRENILDYFHLRYNAVHRGAEQDIRPHLGETPPGIVSFTATCWGRLINPKKMPAGSRTPTAADCYRFVLAQPWIDICMMGVRDLAMLRQNLDGLEQGPMTEDDLRDMRGIGDFLYR